LLFNENFKISRLAGNVPDVGQSMEFDVGVPADLDQLGGDNSHGAVVSGKGLVNLRHGPADGGAFFH
jgi:hypothetical protein